MQKLTKRLTENQKGFYSLVAPELTNFITKRGQEEYLSKLRSAVIDKLGQLEDLEEKLGIDLVTLFKALKNGIWIYDNGSPFFTSIIKLSMHLDAIYCSTSDTYVLLREYGKTWALTKEELE